MPWLPLCLFVSLIVVGMLIKRIKLTLPAGIAWPESEDPGVALQWAGSLEDVDRILGSSKVQFGQTNRKLAIQQQYLDFAFIPLYVSFFVTVTLFHRQNHAVLFWLLLAVAAIGGLFDYIEDSKIIRLCNNLPGSPRVASQIKWTCFFASIGLASWALVFTDSTRLDQQLTTSAIAVVALATAIFGIVAAVRTQFQDLVATVNVAGGIMAALAFMPLTLHYGFSISRVFETAVLMRVPIFIGLFLVALPFIARYTGASSLLLGMFDVTPVGGGAVALAAAFTAGMVSDNSRVIYLCALVRIHVLTVRPTAPEWVWPLLTALLSLPVIVLTVHYTNQQKEGALGKRIFWAGGALGAALGTQILAVLAVKQISLPDKWNRTLSPVDLLSGYFPLGEHLAAGLGFTVALAIYIRLGFYGKSRLGNNATVPALCSALMVMMLTCSSLSALTFFLDKWHIPVLLVLLAFGFITAQSSLSDHLYNLVPPDPDAVPAPTPIDTVRVTKSHCNRRIVVVAANGGGIQAAAWTAQVLEGLCKTAPQNFADSVRLISSVSGGSLGSACYTYRQAEGPSAADASVAAAKSSLDEVAWGIGWPDLFRAVLPWWSKNWIGRGRALEKAWIMNCAQKEGSGSNLDKPLSRWNAKVASGDLPAVILNATIAETGERLLLGTTCFSDSLTDRARVDATKLHQGKDVAAVTAARLSASFPYVTPASRSDLPGPQVHVVDGGYYDNYGMSTLVEWLDEALTEDQLADQRAVDQVLVIQIHGSPVGGDKSLAGKVENRGWFFQILAPITTLNAVRGAGQLAHNDIELELMQQKWYQRGIPVHSVTFEYPDEDAPLSWHLTDAQKRSISDSWNRPEIIVRAKQVVQFLSGSNAFRCECPCCRVCQPPAI